MNNAQHFCKRGLGVSPGAMNRVHFSLFGEWVTRRFSISPSKFSCPRNSPNGEFCGFSQEKISGVELKQRIPSGESRAAESDITLLAERAPHDEAKAKSLHIAERQLSNASSSGGK